MKKNICLIIIMMFIGVTVCAQDFTGKWKLKTSIQGLGEIQFLLDFERTSDSTFIAVSRPEALKEIIGGLKYTIAKKNQLYKNGSLLHIYKGTIESDSLKGLFTTPVGNFNFVATVHDDIMTGALYGNNEIETYFEFSAIPFDNNCLDYDYISLVENIKKTFYNNIYDNKILKKRGWKKFFKKLDKLAPNVCDDLEMFTYFTFLSSKLKMSHISLLKYNYWNDETLEYQPLVSHKYIDENTAYIKFDGFQLADTSVVKDFFISIIDKNISHLIFDFRGCSGGDYSSMLLAEYLVNEPIDAGFFIGNIYFQNNKKLPSDKMIKEIPYYEGKSLKEFIEEIKNNGLLKGRVIPNKNLHFSGQVYALIDNYSASATEPISYFLKQNGLAILIGETTAGEMLSSIHITVKDDWTVILPVADYYTSDRFRIEQKGVKPNIKVKSDTALEYVLKIIAQ